MSACPPHAIAGLLLPALLVALLAGTAPAHAAQVAWLFDVELPVRDRSPGERRVAEQAGLELVLRRVSGLARLPEDNPVLDEARANTGRYYSEYGYVTGPAADAPLVSGEQLRLRLAFDPVLVQQLARQAGLPLWSLNRPLVVVWLAQERDQPGPGGERRRIVAASDDHPLLLALQARARQRGLPVLVPVMDLDDQLNISPVDVWGGFTEALERASARYGANVVVSGRLMPSVFGGVRVEWQISGIDGLDELTFEALDEGGAGAMLADSIADALAARFAVTADDALDGQWITLRVGGIRTFDDYARVLAFLESLEVVRSVSVLGGDARALEFSVESVADVERLSQLLDLDRQLTLLPSTAGGGALDLRWVPR